MSAKHEVVNYETRQHMTNYEGSAVPRIGEHFEYSGDWFRVVHVAWRRTSFGEVVAKILVQRDAEP